MQDSARAELVAREANRRIDISSAAGSFTGWPNGVIKSLVLSSHDADRTELLEAFRDLGNGLSAGTVSRHVTYLWAISRAVLADKPNGGHRSLSIGEDCYRAFACTVARATAAKAGEYLSPLQQGDWVERRRGDRGVHDSSRTASWGWRHSDGTA